MDIIDILAGDGYIIFNKEFAKRYGLEASVLLGAMCGYQKGFRNEYFYREQSKILEDTTLTAYALRSSIKILQGLGIIEYEKRGMPAKYYYKVNVENLERIIDFRKSRVNENANSRDCETVNSCVNENDSTYKNNDKNEDKNNKKENIKEKEPKLTFGEYKQVKLTDDEYQKLNNDYGLIMAEKLITYLDEYIEEKGYKSKSHYLAIKRWVVDAVNKKNKVEKKEESLIDRIMRL